MGVKSKAAPTSGIPRDFDRHRAFKIFSVIFATVAVAVASWVTASLLDQERAILSWEPVEARLQHCNVTDSKLVKKRRTRSWGVDAIYTYTWQGKDYESSQVWFYGNDIGPSYSRAVNACLLHENSSTVFVNPENPTDSVMMRELWFRPYSGLLFLQLISFGFAWIFTTEYDWRVAIPRARTLHPAADRKGWYDLDLGGSKLRHSAAAFAPQALLLTCWHAAGIYLWFRYRDFPNISRGLEFEMIAYHMIGVALVLRLFYLAVLSAFFSDARLQFSTGRVVVDNNIQVRLTQSPTSAITYTTVSLEMTCIETKTTTRNNKTKTNRNTIAKQELDLLLKDGVHQPLSLPAGTDLDVTKNVCFKQHASRETRPTGNVRVLCEWYAVLRIRARFLPFLYTSSAILVVHEHPTK
eukprot:TRINITY_DN8528_c0_g1_i1.p1 TRINITY_DN8528_c0_g1~~TRINITY_DN8528_c0_g1_i1.p1  ORF type:complete len:426 (+),score=75.26 TRINITY_DN8528_c0_g1_i1:50-1279(+)